MFPSMASVLFQWIGINVKSCWDNCNYSITNQHLLYLHEMAVNMVHSQAISRAVRLVQLIHTKKFVLNLNIISCPSSVCNALTRHLPPAIILASWFIVTAVTDDLPPLSFDLYTITCFC